MSLAHIGSSDDWDAGQRRIAQRKGRADQRRDRLLESKQRSISFAKDANDKIIEEKRRQKLMQLQESQREHEKQEAVLQLMNQMAAQRHMEKQYEKAALAAQWKKQTLLQSKLDPDWDIHDPDSLRKDRPARIDDAGTNVGVSSMQIFDGEDLRFAERTRQMGQTMRADLQGQMGVKAGRIIREAQMDAAYFAAQNLVCQHVEAIKLEETTQKRREVEQVAEYNQAQHHCKTIDAGIRSKDSDALSALELEYQRKHGFVNKRSTGDWKNGRDTYKGMSAAERQVIWAEQAKQRGENTRRRQGDRELEAKYAQNQKVTQAMLAKVEVQKLQETKERESRHELELLAQQREYNNAAAIKIAEEKTPGFSPAFYSAFNNGGR